MLSTLSVLYAPSGREMKHSLLSHNNSICPYWIPLQFSSCLLINDFKQMQDSKTAYIIYYSSCMFHFDCESSKTSNFSFCWNTELVYFHSLDHVKRYWTRLFKWGIIEEAWPLTLSWQRVRPRAAVYSHSETHCTNQFTLADGSSLCTVSQAHVQWIDELFSTISENYSSF